MTGRPSGRTRVVGIIGDPVEHTRSPAIHNAAFAACGLDWVYVAFSVPAGRGADAVRGAGALGLAGLNVTMPHKSEVAAACDTASADAVALGAVNTVVFDAGSTRGESTDGAGFLDAIGDANVPVAGRVCVVAGAGGAARAVVLALGRAGADVVVAARRPDAASATAALAPGARAVDLADLDAAVATCDVLVNATPLGMNGESLPFDASKLRPEQAVVDLVYHPLETPLLAAARAAGARPVDGLGMLVHQAALSFGLWTGVEPPFAVMRAAAEQAS